MNIAFIGLGSNLNNPVAQLNSALVSMGQLDGVALISTSSFYQSKPLGPQNQNDFVNAVTKIKSSLDPIALLDHLQNIERQQGRTRNGEHWGPRTLDLDILLYNNTEINHPRLTVPHYGMHERSFVLLPLLEIEPMLSLPNGKRVESFLNDIDLNDIEKIS